MSDYTGSARLSGPPAFKGVTSSPLAVTELLASLAAETAAREAAIAAETAARSAADLLMLPLAGGRMTGLLKHAQGSTGLELYLTADEVTNYERASLRWSATEFLIQTEKAGTGVDRNVKIMASNGAGIIVTPSYGIVFRGKPIDDTYYSITPVAESGIKIQGAQIAGTTNPSILLGDTGNGYTAAAGTQRGTRIEHTLRQSGTAGFVALGVNVAEVSAGSGVKTLLDLAYAGASKFDFTSAGVFTLNGLAVSNVSGYLGVAGVQVASGANGFRGPNLTILSDSLITRFQATGSTQRWQAYCELASGNASTDFTFVTGVARAAGDKIVSFKNSSTEMAYLLGSGNLVIGGTLTSGIPRLYVKGSSDSDSYMRFDASAGLVQTILGSSNTLGFAGTLSNHAFEFRTNNTARFSIAAGGQVTFTTTEVQFTGTGTAIYASVGTIRSDATGNAFFSPGGSLLLSAATALATIGATTGRVILGTAGGSGYPGIWFGSATPSLSNFAFLSDFVNGGIVILNSPAYVVLRNANADVASTRDGRWQHKVPNSAPTDANIFTQAVSWYVDETANKLHVRVKYGGGTLKLGEIALA